MIAVHIYRCITSKTQGNYVTMIAVHIYRCITSRTQGNNVK